MSTCFHLCIILYTQPKNLPRNLLKAVHTFVVWAVRNEMPLRLTECDYSVCNECGRITPDSLMLCY